MPACTMPAWSEDQWRKFANAMGELVESYINNAVPARWFWGLVLFGLIDSLVLPMHTGHGSWEDSCLIRLPSVGCFSPFRLATHFGIVQAFLPDMADSMNLLEPNAMLLIYFLFSTVGTIVANRKTDA